jgi:hypothetical protein
MRQLSLLADGNETGGDLMRQPAQGCTSSSTARRKARALPSNVVMSRKMMPGLG